MTPLQNAFVDPGTDQVKQRIRDIGIIEARDGRLNVQNWCFNTYITWIPQGTETAAAVIDDHLAGWPMWELHDIAHGYPCGCGVEAILYERGLLPEHSRGPKA